MAKIEPIYSSLNASFMKYGIFHDRLSIDESMVPYDGRHSCRIFFPGKPIPFGYKLWGLCGPDGYPYKFNIYTGKCETRTEHFGSSVVNTMVNVVIEKSVALKHTFYGNVYFCKWNDNAIVSVRSNFTSHMPVSYTKHRVKKDKDCSVTQPNRIGVGGADVFDCLLGSYRPTTTGKKWYWPLFINEFNVSIVAAWRIHCYVNVSKMSHLD